MLPELQVLLTFRRLVYQDPIQSESVHHQQGCVFLLLYDSLENLDLIGMIILQAQIIYVLYRFQCKIINKQLLLSELSCKSVQRIQMLDEV